jgi:NAD(P)-dependent dehydrogenase (short-subunit alcohol dehydrogenase family)
MPAPQNTHEYSFYDWKQQIDLFYSTFFTCKYSLTTSWCDSLNKSDRLFTANTILPSIIDTPSNRAAMGVENADKWVKPESIAQVICFLASEAAKDVRGAAIFVYGNL